MSDDAIAIVDIEPVHAVVLPEPSVPDDLGETISRSITRVTSFLGASRVSPSGPPFVRYLEWEPQRRIEIGFPVATPEAVPGLRSTVLPGGETAHLLHVGPYDDLPAAFTRLREWVETNAEHRSAPWESYWTPHGDDSPRTEIFWPVRS